MTVTTATRTSALEIVPLSPAIGAEANAPSVWVAPVTLPEAVDRPQLVVRVTPNRVAILDGHRWAEPLAGATLAAGTVTGSLQPASGTYYWRATYTPTDTYNLTSTSACSAKAIVHAHQPPCSSGRASITATARLASAISGA